jgi:putative FmdB family regulatory protein
MPTYDYQCDACDHKFELFQSMKDEPETKCPSCKKRRLRRLIGTGAAIMFKGSGFYITDYRSESYKKGAAADAKTESSSKGETCGGDACKSGCAGGDKAAPVEKKSKPSESKAKK